MAVVTSLVARISADTSAFNDSMAASAKSANGVQQAMQQGAQAATLLQSRLTSLKQAFNLGQVGAQEYGAALLTVKADAAELATQGTLAEGTTARLAATSASAARAMRSGLETVGASSLGTERAVSRLSFGLSMMAQNGLNGARGLRGVEMGLMSLVPGLGWGLVAVTGLIEGLHLLGRATDEAAKKAEEDARRFQESIGRLSISAPELTEPQKMAALQSRLATARQDVARAQAALDSTSFPRAQGGSGNLAAIATATALYNEKVDALAAAQSRLDVVQQQLTDNTRAQVQTTAAAKTALEGAGRATTEHASRVPGLIAALERERATFGMTHAQIELYELRMAGASAATLRHAAAVERDIEALEKGRATTRKIQEEMARDRDLGMEKEAERTRKFEDLARQRIRAQDEEATAARSAQERMQEDAKKSADATQHLLDRLLGEAVHGNIGGMVQTLGEEAIRHLTQARPADSVGKTPPLSTRIPLDLWSPRSDVDSKATDLMRKSGAPPVGHTVQSSATFIVNTIDSEGFTTLLAKHGDAMANIVADKVALSPGLRALFGPGGDA